MNKEIVVKVEKRGNRFLALIKGRDFVSEISTGIVKRLTNRTSSQTG